MVFDRPPARVHRLLSTIRFVGSALILGWAAVWLSPVVDALSHRYSKQSIPVRRPLSEFSARALPAFQNGWQENHARASARDIGTDEYVHTVLTRDAAVGFPNHLEFFVTYYSDPRDPVPHTPEVCSRQAGAIVEQLDTVTLDVPELADEHGAITCRRVVLSEQKHNSTTLYVFFVEGKFRHLRSRVRWDIGKPGNAYTYFSKIEAACMFKEDSDRERAIAACEKLLAEALPVLLNEYFPTYEQVKRN